MTSSNLVTLLTPSGVGALAVVRVAGPATGAFLATHFSKPCAVGRCVHGELRDGDAVIDDPVVVIGPGASFADISLHGGPWVVRRAIELAVQAGFRESSDGTIVDADGRLEGELLTALPLARTELALRTLLAQPAAWQAVSRQPPGTTLRRVLADEALFNLLRLPRVAIVGVPNAGKSTLANALFGVDRSITADLPGTTRDWVGEIADIDGLAVMLIDTPGLRDTADTIERRAIELAGVQVGTADLVIVVLDATQPLEPNQSAIVQRHPVAIVAVNKSDQPCDWRPHIAGGIEMQARSGVGIAELKREILRRFDCVDVDPNQARCWTGRQRDLVETMLSNALAR
jgi:tRNA modification GTPase